MTILSRNNSFNRSIRSVWSMAKLSCGSILTEIVAQCKHQINISRFEDMFIGWCFLAVGLHRRYVWVMDTPEPSKTIKPRLPKEYFQGCDDVEARRRNLIERLNRERTPESDRALREIARMYG